MRQNHTWRTATSAVLLTLAIASTGVAKEKDPQPQSGIPAGSQINVRLKDKLRSDKNKTGDQFRGKLDSPIVADGRVLYAKGTEVGGYVVRSHPSARPGDLGVLELDLLSVGAGANMAAVTAKTLVLKGDFAKSGKAAAEATSGRKVDSVADSSTVLTWVTIPAGARTSLLTNASSNTRRGSSGTPFRIVRRNESGEIITGSDEPDGFAEQDRRVLRTCLAKPRSTSAQAGTKPASPARTATRLQKNGTLSPALRKQAQPLPARCTPQLSPIPRNWARVVLDNRVLLLDPTSRIADVLVF